MVSPKSRGRCPSGNLLVIRIRNNGTLGESKACYECEQSLLSWGLTQYYHSTNEGTIIKRRLYPKKEGEKIRRSKGWEVYKNKGILL